uniref:Putative secreted protein n=1 Tax=Ixodes ricinus TaxID=34613 RepID=A0A6B0UN91_IXORI
MHETVMMRAVLLSFIVSSSTVIASSIIRTGAHRGTEVRPSIFDQVHRCAPDVLDQRSAPSWCVFSLPQRAPRKSTVRRGAVPSGIAARSGNREDGGSSRRADYLDGDLAKTNTPRSCTR